MSTEQYFLTFLITKTTSDQFAAKPFAKMILYFDILTIPSILNLESSLLISLLKLICVWFYINRLDFNCAMSCIVIFINYII